MICVSVTPKSRTLAKVDILNASVRGDIVEVCVDYLLKEPDMNDLLSGSGKPLLVSCRREQDGGRWTGSEDARFNRLRQAIIAGPAYVELELDVASKIPRFGDTKRVVSYTSLHRPITNADEIIDQAIEADADIVKLTAPAPDLDAAWPLLVAMTKPRQVPVVGVGIGAAGITSSLLGVKFGAPWMYAALEPGMETHEGQATVFDLDRNYQHAGLNRETRLIAVAGLDTAAIETARVMNAGFQATQTNIRCLPLVVGRIEKLMKRLEQLRIRALIMPPQTAANLGLKGDLNEDAVERAGFADLLMKHADGWQSFNLLWRSTLRVLERSLGSKTEDEKPLDRRNVLLLGAGPLTRSIVHGVQRRKGIVSISSGRAGEAAALAKELGLRQVPMHNLYNTLADVVILTDPGMQSGHRQSEFNPAFFRPNMTVIDVSRVPEDTDLLKEARERGAKVIEPQTLFAEIIAAQFKPLAGKKLPADAIRQDG